MKTIAISDLHGLLPEIVEPADIMFICGDISPLHIQFNKPEMWKWLTGEFMDWIIGLPVEKVYLVAGNHDAFFEGASTSKKVELSFLSSHKLIYLENELVYYVDNDGITWSIFGTPYCHQYGNWPFMRTDAYMEEKFKEIPDEVNFILTHDTPTDGLGISNSDLDQIGAKSYAEVDDILQTMLLYKNPEREKFDILYSKYGEEVVNKVWNRHLASEFKRKNLPVVIERELYI